VGNYYWVGGYTGNIGAGSGYSGNFQESGIAVWTNRFTGTTGTAGDLHFGPYYWGFKQNWLEAIQATNSSSVLLVSATRTPKNGDTATLNPQVTSGHTPYSISLLFGGVSGASGFWEGTTSQSALSSFSVLPMYGKTTSDLNNTTFLYENGAVGWGQYINNGPWKGLDTRRVGIEYNSYTGAPTNPPPEVKFVEGYVDPLDIRAATVNFSPTRATGWLRTIGTHTTVVSMTELGGTGQTLNLCGTVGTIDQRSGYFNSVSLSGSNLTIDRLQVYGRVGGILLNPQTTVNTVVECFPSRTDSYIAVSCNCPDLKTQSGSAVGNEAGLTGVVYYVGNLGGSNSSSITTWTAKQGLGAFPPTVYMYNFICDYITAENVKMYPPSGQSGFERFIFPVFRDGQLGANTLIECNKSSDPTWDNVIIGYSPSDEGLRIDDLTARINFHIGDNVKINGKEYPIGVTS